MMQHAFRHFVMFRPFPCAVLLRDFVLQVSGPIMTRSDFVRVQGPWLLMTAAQTGSEVSAGSELVFNSEHMCCNVLSSLQSRAF